MSMPVRTRLRTISSVLPIALLLGAGSALAQAPQQKPATLPELVDQAIARSAQVDRDQSQVNLDMVSLGNVAKQQETTIKQLVAARDDLEKQVADKNKENAELASKLTKYEPPVPATAPASPAKPPAP